VNNLKESYLHFIWKYKLLDISNLSTTQGEKVSILNSGSHNPNQGPDFLQAQIQIGENTFYGHVEMHIDNKNWYEHNHQFDPNYDNTILHVVYHRTGELYTLSSSNTQIPILCLESCISKFTLDNIEYLMTTKSDIPCQKIFKLPADIHISQFKTRLFSERLIRKSAWIKELIRANNNDYETSFYQAMLYGFGIKVNADIFLELAKSIPQKILTKYNSDLIKLEAIFLGQANLIEPIDIYSSMLYTEYEYLKKLHNLQPILTKPMKSKMLPSSFPTIRLVQFAAFIYNRQGLFSKLIQFKSIGEIKFIFEIQVSEYWITHYDFGKLNQAKKTNNISDSFFEKLLINIILPFKFLIEIEEEKSSQNTIEIFSKLKPEVNIKTKKMSEVFGFENKSAFDSQALNEWFTNFCVDKKCLECTIGLNTLKTN
jgi:hypothetical protein